MASTRSDHGGTSRTIPPLCDALADLGHQVKLATARAADPAISMQLPERIVDIGLATEGRFLRQRPVIRDWSKWLATWSSDSNPIVHDHGLWLPSNHFVAKWCRQNKRPRIVSPHGMATRWSIRFRAAKKKLVWKLYQQTDLLSADGIHVTSQQELDELLEIGVDRPSCIAPNGMDVPAEVLREVDRRANLLGQRVCSSETKTALFLSRIHPKKGLLDLVRAWADVNPSDWKLRIVGPDEGGHTEVVRSEIRQLGMADRIALVEEVNDVEKWNEYLSADLFVLPTYSENFGIVIAEAMAAGLPVITTTSAPWQVLSEHNLGWWIEPNQDSLSNALHQATGLTSTQRREKGLAASLHARNEYSWAKAAEKLSAFYKSFL
ncbi:glycosyltransferase [Rhodopirellula sp. UBA1907]|uniref:glycosyltransferase n=1 Tax=Rhodopirellula sp. UBA1907 TaxID=1947381 RepID=UPI00257D2B19|nr:glycosyltransferase [Rhodopirellula sp. UBA1907]